MSDLTDEKDFVRLYAQVWNTLDTSPLREYLDAGVRYLLQETEARLEGREAVMSYRSRKVEAVKESDLPVYAEMGCCGSQEGPIRVTGAPEGRPCVVLAQPTPEDVVAMALLDIKAESIQRIVLCTTTPDPATAKRTGTYPGRKTGATD